MRTIAASSSKRNCESAPGGFGFTDPGRSQKEKDAHRSIGIRKPRTTALDRFDHAFERGVLADDPVFQGVEHIQQTLAFALHHLRYGNARPARDDIRDVFVRNLFFEILAFAFGDRSFQARHLFFESDDLPVTNLRDPC